MTVSSEEAEIDPPQTATPGRRVGLVTLLVPDYDDATAHDVGDPGVPFGEDPPHPTKVP